MGTSLGAYELNHKSLAPERVPMFYYCVNTQVQMFYFDSNTFVPLECPELAIWKANVDRVTFGRLFLLFPPPVKNTHLVFLTFYFHFLSKHVDF